MALLPLNLPFETLFVELTTETIPVQRRRVSARVRVSVGGTSTGWIELPPIEILLPVIPLPTIAIFCEHKDFGGAKLIVVPSNSPLQADTLAPALSLVRDAINAVSGLAATLSLFLDNLDQVIDLVQSGQIAFRRASSIDNFNNIDLYTGLVNDTEAEDELSSLVLVGPPRRQLQLFNDRELDRGEGQINVTLNQALTVRIANLHSSDPAADPAGTTHIVKQPPGGWFNPDDFGDELSSMRFAWT